MAMVKLITGQVRAIEDDELTDWLRDLVSHHTFF